MVDAADASAAAMRRDRLVALGLTPLTLRRREAAPTPEASIAPKLPGPVRLVVRGADEAFDGGEGAGLFGAVLALLGLERQDVSTKPADGVPVLAFGAGQDATTCIAALRQLREAHEKRAAWPALRSLRRRLRGARQP